MAVRLDERARLTGRVRRFATAGAAVAAAGALANVLAYFVPLIGARHLSAADFSALATVMAICAIAGVPALGLQTAVAVHSARHGAVQNLARLTTLTAALTAGLLIAAAPLLGREFDLPIAAILLAAAMTTPVVVASARLGLLQGTRRFGPLALGMVLLGLARSGGVILGLLLDLGVLGVLATGVAGAVLALVLVRLLPLGTGSAHATAAEPTAEQPAPVRTLGRDILAATSATLAMFLVSYADLLAARRLLPTDQAAEYAVLAVLTKGALWAPQVITVLALPYLAKGVRHSRLLAASAVLGVGAMLVGATALADDFAVQLAGGSRYAHLGSHAAMFAATGALFALVFVLTNARVAAGAKAPAAPLWLALAGFNVAMLVLPDPSVQAIVTGALITATCCALVLALLSRRQEPTGQALSQPSMTA